MKLIKGKRLAHQPKYLQHGFKININQEDYSSISEKDDWCNKTFGYSQYINYEFKFHWMRSYGTKYVYYFFKKNGIS